MQDLTPSRLLLEDALHLEQERLALLPVQLLGLTAEEIVNLGQRAEGEGAVLGDEGFTRPSYSTPPSFAQAQRPRGPSSTSRRESPPPLGLFPRSAAQQPDPRAARRPLTTTRSAAHHPLGTRPTMNWRKTSTWVDSRRRSFSCPSWCWGGRAGSSPPRASPTAS